MDQERNKNTAKVWHESLGIEQSKEFYDGILHKDFTAYLFGQSLTRAQYIETDSRFSKAFSESKTTIEDQVAEDDKVVSAIRWQAIHVSEFLGMPAAGMTFNIQGVTIDHFKNGLVISHYPLFDTAQLFSRQIVREKIRTQIARDLHDNIGSTLGSIAYYSQMAQHLKGSNPDQLSVLLKKIEESSHEAVDEMSDIVWAINPANNSFEKLALRMRNFATALFVSRNIGFHFEAKNIPEILTLSTERRKNLFLIFKEAAFNAAKYSACTSFHTSIRKSNHAITIDLHDNGKGFNLAQVNSYNGNGIANMKHRAKEIGAEILISSEPGAGTRISVELPLVGREPH